MQKAYDLKVESEINDFVMAHTDRSLCPADDVKRASHSAVLKGREIGLRKLTNFCLLGVLVAETGGAICTSPEFDAVFANRAADPDVAFEAFMDMTQIMAEKAGA